MRKETGMEQTVAPWPSGPPAGWIVDLAGWSSGESPFYENIKHRRSFLSYAAGDMRVVPGVSVEDTPEEAAEAALGMLNRLQAMNPRGHWDVEPGGVAWAGLRAVDDTGRALSPAALGGGWKVLMAESGDGRTPPVVISWDGGEQAEGQRAEVRPDLGRLDGYETLAETEEVIRSRMGANAGYEINMRVSPGAGYTGEFAVHWVDKPPSYCLEREYSPEDLDDITYMVLMDYRRLAAAASDEEAVETARDLMGDWLERWSVVDQASDFEPVLVGRVRRGHSGWLVSDGNGRSAERRWSPDWNVPEIGEAEQDILLYPAQHELPAMAAYTDGSPRWARAEVLDGGGFPRDESAVRAAVAARFGTVPVAPHLSLLENRSAPARSSAGAGW